MLVVLSSAFAASTDATGVLFGNEVYLNGIELGTYTAVTPGDVIRTKERSGATLQFPHSIAMITPDSVVRVENQSLVLDVGTITLTTGEDVKGVVADIRIGAPGLQKLLCRPETYWSLRLPKNSLRLRLRAPTV